MQSRASGGSLALGRAECNESGTRVLRNWYGEAWDLGMCDRWPADTPPAAAVPPFGESPDRGSRLHAAQHDPMEAEP